MAAGDRDPADAGAAGGQRGQGGHGGDLVGHGGQVGVDRAEPLGAVDGQAGAVAGHGRAHRLQQPGRAASGCRVPGVALVTVTRPPVAAARANRWAAALASYSISRSAAR